MKRIAALLLASALLCALVACQGKEASRAPAVPAAPAEGGYGWHLTYDEALVEHRLEGGGEKFVYTGEAPGECYFAISVVSEESPTEALGEKTADWEESQLRSEGYLVGTDDRWSYTRMRHTEENGLHRMQQFTAAEFNGNVLLLEFLMHTDGDGERDMRIGDALANLAGSIAYDDFAPQTELSHVPGTYTAKRAEEIEGKTVETVCSITLNEDHTGTLRLQDKIDILWGSIELIPLNGGEHLEYTIEGDNLYLCLDENWLEFAREQ